jgi:hypothetical protein
MGTRAWIIAVVVVVLLILFVAFARGREVHNGIRGDTNAPMPAALILTREA